MRASRGHLYSGIGFLLPEVKSSFRKKGKEVQPKSGYKTITPIQICNALSLLGEKRLSKKALQIYFACFALVAIREAANRSVKKNQKKGRVIPSYRLKELSKATQLPLNIIKKELIVLESLKLLIFSESEITISKNVLEGSEELLENFINGRSPKRPIPIPRSIFRYLSKCKKESITKTLLAYILRGLTLTRDGEIKGQGSVKCSWISCVMDMSLRSVKSARKELIELGIIPADTRSHQLKLNKTGAYFTINLDWIDYRKEESVIGQNKIDNITYQQKMTDNSVDNSFLPQSEFAPLPSEKVQVFALPYKDKKTSSKEESKYQKPLSTSCLKPSGVFIKPVEKEKPPTIKNITFDDFKSFYRTEELYFQAVKAKWVTDSENSFLNWMSAAVRAKTLTNGDSVRVFVGIVRKKLFTHITQAEEERARAAIKKFRYGVEPASEELMKLVA